MLKSLPYLLIITFLFAACKKSTPAVPTSVAIAGKSYPVTIIKDQIWTSVNYDGSGGYANPIVDESVYGKFYSFSDLSNITLPAGWRVPTEADFIKLIKNVGVVTETGTGAYLLDTLYAIHLRSVSDWGLIGDNLSGFNALPSGEYNAYADEVEQRNASTYFWSTSSGSPDAGGTSIVVLEIDAYRLSPGNRYVHINSTGVNNSFSISLAYTKLPVRFVKDH